MILYIVFGLIFLGLVVLAVLSAKELHWVNSLIVILLFLSSAAASMGMAGVLHQRSKQVSKLSKVQSDLTRVTNDYNKVVFGSADDIGYGKTSLRALSAKLALLQVGSGRVWKQGRVTQADGEWSFTFPNAAPEGSENQMALLKDIEVHVFSDRPFQVKTSQGPTQIVVPVGYVGKFRIIESNLQGFLLDPLRVINQQEAGQPTSTWTVFEKMPIDHRGSFKDALTALNPDVDLEALTISQFRQVLQTNFFPADRFPFDADSAEYERLIDRYAFDGRSLGQIEKWVEGQISSGNRKSGTFQPLPEEVHVRYRFNKDSEEYTVDADGELDTDGAFTPLGLAVAPNLHVGSKVQLKKDNEVLIDSQTAAGYDRDGTQIEPFSSSADVTELDRIFIRKNRDFPYLFARLAERGEQRQETIEDRKQDNALYDNEISKNLAQQIQERTRLQGDLESDNRNLEVDRETILAAESRRRQQVESMVEKISTLIQEQKRLRDQLGQVSRRLRTSEAQTDTASVEPPEPAEGLVEQPISTVVSPAVRTFQPALPIQGQRVIQGQPIFGP